MSKLLWSPTKNEIKNTQAWEFIQEVNNKFEINLDSFRDLYQWSCDFPESFWGLFWSYSLINADRNPTNVLNNGNDFLGSEWFSDAKLNFAKNLLLNRDKKPAIIFCGLVIFLSLFGGYFGATL